MEQGAVNVHVQAANAEVTGQSSINQLTYDKRVDCTPGQMGHGLEDKNTPALLDVTYRTSEDAGTYLISFVPTDGGVASGPIPSSPVNGAGTVKVSASQNKGSQEREVGKLVFSPALNGKEISLIGYTPKEVPVIQSPAPVPVASIRPTGNITDLAWNQSNHSFTVEVDNVNFVETNEVSITTLPKSKMIDMTVPSSGTLGQPVAFTLTPNRGDAPKSRTVKVSVDGHGDHVGEEQVTFTQQAPDVPVKEPVLAATPGNSLPWDATEATLNLTDLDKIFEVQAGKESVNASEPLNVTLPAGGFNLTADKSSASMKVTFPKNDVEKERKVKVIATAIGNRESVKKIKEIILTQAKKLFGKIFFPSPTTVEVPWTQNNFGSVPLQMENINKPTQGGVTFSTNPTADFISLGTDGSAMTYAIAQNQGLTRTIQITAKGQDIWGNDVTTPTPLTMTQKGGPGSLEIRTKDLMLDRNDPGRNLVLNMQRIQSSTAKISYPSWIQSARLLGDRIEVVPKANTGDSGERVGNVSIEAKGNDEVLVKSNTVQIKQKPNIVSVNNSTFTLGGIFKGDVVHWKDIFINSDSRRAKSARIRTHIAPSDDIRPKLHQLQYNKKALFRIEAKGNVADYNELRRDIEVVWTSPEDIETVSKCTIIRPGHPMWKFRINSGNLPHNGAIQANVNGPAEYKFACESENLLPSPNGLIRVEFTRHPENKANFKVQLLDADGDEGYLPTNRKATGTIKLIVYQSGGHAVWGDLKILGGGVDGTSKVLHTIHYRP